MPAFLAPLAASAVLLLQVACGGDDPVAPRVATTVTANSATTLTAVAGGAATPLPSVVVRDQDGAAMAGASVTFAVASGGGSIAGGSGTTNGSGVATVGSWTLGTAAGPNTLTATAAGLAPIIFTANGTAGLPATLTKSAGDGQTALAGTAVSVAPGVTVRDANGNPVPNAMVTFAVATGGGSVTSAQATSTIDGVATVGSWTLGPAGPNTLTASAIGVTAVTFSATSVDPCTTFFTHVFGTTTNGQLTTADCRIEGSYFDFYRVTVPSGAAYRFTQTSPTLDSYLYFFGGNGVLAAQNDDAAQSSLNSAIKALLPPGDYSLAASSYDENETGAYALTSALTTSDVTNCEEVFVVRGVTSAQSLQTTDCFFQSRYGDDYWILLRAGEPITISMSSTAVDALLQIWTLFGQQVASNDNRDPSTTDAQLTYTSTENSYFVISATSNVAGQTGAYTLSIAPPALAAEAQAGRPQMQLPSWGRRALSAGKPTSNKRPPR